ncbi:MAG: VacJ family lipoprotein [Alphaproteobacteria bacterium]|nr:VacJ family lipoprotein [Alphaproteobacteria bacterium]
MMMRYAKLFAVSFLALFLLSACASTPRSYAEQRLAAENNDPLEPMNRVIFNVNDFLDRLLLRPLAELYRATVPPPIRTRVAAIIKNMGEPVIMANNILQGRMHDAGITFSRFVVNTTIGLGGMFEVANAKQGLPRQTGDFGQTLSVWGFGEGPYLVLPLVGPSTVRDAVGIAADTMASPWQYIVAGQGGTTIRRAYFTATTIAPALSKRESALEELDVLRAGSLDFYAQVRSMYRQYRAGQLGKPLNYILPTFDDEEDDLSP